MVVLSGSIGCWLGNEERKAISAEFYVSTEGRDTNAGTKNKPFRTLEAARNAIRQLKKQKHLITRKEKGLPKGGVTVWLRRGVYERTRTFELNEQDSGTKDAPIVYRAVEGEAVHLVGGKAIPSSAFKPVTDPAVLERLDPAVRGKVFQTDLRAQGVTDFGGVTGHPWGKSEAGTPPLQGGPELFFQDRPMTLSRWPNTGFVNIVDVVGGAPHHIHGRKYDGDRPRRWLGEKDLWLHGYWFWDWADQRQKVESIDTEQRIISLVPPYHWYGYRKGQRYYAFNALSEIDSPGEWYLDRETGILYFWPPAPLEAEAVTPHSAIPNPQLA